MAHSSQIKRPLLLRESPHRENKSAVAETAESLKGMYVSQPDRNLKRLWIGVL